MMRSYLKDKTGFLACLVNCNIYENYIHCGAIIFRGGLYKPIKLFNWNFTEEYLIQVPEEVRRSGTYYCVYSSNDNIKILRN